MDDKKDSPPPRIADAVTELLHRHGVPERKHLATLEDVLDLTYQQARRRMSGESPWRVEEVERLAVHFSEPLFALVATMLNSAGERRHALMQIGNAAVPCTIWLGRLAPADDRIGPLMALPGEGSWRVVTVSDAGAQVAYEISRLVFEAAAPPRVAVLDDDPNVAEPIAEFLREKGIAALSYFKPEHLKVALETASFDGFIVDWLLTDGNVVDLLARIRQKTATAPIVILTGRVNDGSVEEEEIARAMALYHCMLYEKPARSVALYNALMITLRKNRGNPPPPPVQ